MAVESSVFKYADNIDTDVIIPARRLVTSEPKELAAFCMEDIDENFAKTVQDGDVIVAGENFGCGSSREHAPIAIKASGIRCVVAASFARIFYRNSFNIGLPIFECKEASEKIQPGDKISVDFETGVITNITRSEEYRAQPLPDFMRSIIEADGLLNYIKKQVG